MKLSSVGSVRTAVSLDSELFKQLEEVAKSCGQSRSAVVAVALRKYLLDQETRRFTESMNEAYKDDPGWTDEQRATWRAHQRSFFPDDKW